VTRWGTVIASNGNYIINYCKYILKKWFTFHLKKRKNFPFNPVICERTRCWFFRRDGFPLAMNKGGLTQTRRRNTAGTRKVSNDSNSSAVQLHILRRMTKVY
jgi:hypothetical protein